MQIEQSDKVKNEVIKMLFDPNDYCKLCDGHLLGIRHLVECRRKSEKAAEDETGEKEDNSEKVNRVEDKETEAKLTPEEPKSVFPRLRTCTGVGDQTTTEGGLTSEMSRSEGNYNKEAFDEREDEKVQDKDGEVKEEVKNEDEDDKKRVKVKNEDEDDKKRVKVKDEKDKEEENKDEDKKEKVKEDDNFSPPAKKIRKAQFSPLFTRGGLGPLLRLVVPIALLYTCLASSLAMTVRLSDEWTRTVNVSQLPPPSATASTDQTYTPATGTTPGSGYDVSVKCWKLGTNRRCPLPAFIKGQYMSNVFYNWELYGVSTPRIYYLASYLTAAHCKCEEDMVVQDKFFFPFLIKRKDVLFLPNPTIASRQMGVKDPCLATFPISLVHQERMSTVKHA